MANPLAYWASPSVTKEKSFTTLTHGVSFLQETLDRKMDGPYNVVVGEAFSMDIDYVQGPML
jgi:hypothetical protein